MSEEMKNDQTATSVDRMEELEEKRLFMTPGQIVMRQFLRNKLAVCGVVILVAMALFCFVGPMFSDYGEAEMFYVNPDTGEEIRMTDHTSIASAVLNAKAKPSAAHWLGTNEQGQDVLTRLMYGGRISLMVGFVVVAVELIIGITLGGIAGYYGGKVDMVIMRIVEMFVSIPFIPLMLIVSSMLVGFKISPQYKIYYTMFIMGLIFWAGVARMVRGQILALREMEYMQAAEATGIRTSRKIFRHLVPNVMPVIIVMATMDLGSVILMESTMSFLGIGVGIPYASWGNMVQSVNDNVIMRQYMNIWVPPGLCILLVVLAFNFVGDGLRDAFDPKMKR